MKGNAPAPPPAFARLRRATAWSRRSPKGGGGKRRLRRREGAARERIETGLAESAYVKHLLLRRCVPQIEAIAAAATKALRAGRRVFLFGNGGSAADAQHIAGELEGRFKRERRALPVLSLTTNTSTLTAIGNDFGYEKTFARQVEAHVRRGDVVIAISTSGNSPNVLEAVKAAKKAGAIVAGFTNEKGGKLRKAADLCLTVPSTDTQRVQECHIAAGHVMCDAVETALFG
ncbi:MAG: SIS domain-containing protein [Planctomycetes bacterium]|nr:SIS domain-containing protein [Planctomycetota bacterium]